jgi:hypothetical protein
MQVLAGDTKTGLHVREQEVPVPTCSLETKETKRTRWEREWNCRFWQARQILPPREAGKLTEAGKRRAFVKLTVKVGIQLPELSVQVSARCFREMIIAMHLVTLMYTSGYP